VGALEHFRLADQPGGVFLRLPDHALGFLARLLQNPLRLRSQAVRPLHLLRQRLPDFLDELQHLAGVDQGAVADGHARRVLHQLLQSIQQQQQVHPIHPLAPSFPRSLAYSRSPTAAGTHWSTGPPNAATSLTSVELTCAYWGDVGMNKVSKSGASCLFMKAICTSYSKSSALRTPRTMTCACLRAAYSTTRPENASHTTVGRCAVASRSSSSRSSTVNSGRLLVFSSTATYRRSNSGAARAMM